MKILVLNSGSSSVKYQLFDMKDETVLAKGLAERIGLPKSILTHRPTGKEKVVMDTEMPDHSKAIKMVLEALAHLEYGVLKGMNEIDAIGHRVAHGGNYFNKSVFINPEAKGKIRKLIELAPLHNGPNLMGIEACEKILPGIPQVAVFDTAFHQSMPASAYLYSLPYELYEKYAIRKYGFHGTSHKYVAERAAFLAGRPLNELKIVTCHLGNGASIAAVDGGKSIDTSMGFTPLEGLTMGTRCGDIDPAIVTFLLEKEKMSAEEVNNLMNKKSGVLGISGISSDFRDLESAAKEGNERAQLALDIFNYNVKKYIGAYAAILGGIDSIVFTAGLGENSPEMRAAVCQGLEYLGFELDANRNQIRGQETEISKHISKGKIFVIPTNEELMIARDTNDIIQN